MSTKEKVSRVVSKRRFRYPFSIVGGILILASFFLPREVEHFLKIGYPGILLFNILSSGLILIPIALRQFPLLSLIIICALGNIINTSVYYFVGYNSDELFQNNILLIRLTSLFKKSGLWGVYQLAIIPLPIDINGLLSGYIGIPYKKYIPINFLGKCTQFALEAAIIMYIVK